MFHDIIAPLSVITVDTLASFSGCRRNFCPRPGNEAMVVITLTTLLHVSLSSQAANVLINWLSRRRIPAAILWSMDLFCLRQLNCRWSGRGYWTQSGLLGICHYQWRWEWLWVLRWELKLHRFYTYTNNEVTMHLSNEPAELCWLHMHS